MYDPPLRKDPMLEETLPGVFLDVEQNDDATEFTLKLREGLKWSDGEPFTVDDILFVLEDVYTNEDLHPSYPTWLVSDGEPVETERVDDYTLKLTFALSNGLFRESMTDNLELVNFPRHYAEQFLPAFNENLDEDTEEAGYSVWTDLWENNVTGESWWTNPDYPTLKPWIVTTPLGDGSYVVFERNPYYWKTDVDGRQLPYIDEISLEVVSDPEVMVLKATDGELDFLFRHANTSENKPVFADEAESAGMRIVDATPTSMNTMAIALNLAHKDEAKAELYRNKDFRIGLSHAIDREEIITAVWQRQGEPWQLAPHADSIYYDEEWAKQYTEFDVDLANEHLDKAGITERDSGGYRTMPDGESLTITLDVPMAVTPEWPTAAAIIERMWGEVGIRLSVNTIDRTLFYDRKVPDANEHDAGVWGGDGGLAVEAIDPRWYFPYTDESIWATPWAQWYGSRGQQGTEPAVDAAREQIELFWEFAETPEEEDREAIFRNILEIAKEEFWAIGIGSLPNPYWVVSERLKNVVGGVPDTWVYRTPGHGNPPTWFIDEGV